MELCADYYISHVGAFSTLLVVQDQFGSLLQPPPLVRDCVVTLASAPGNAFVPEV